MQGFIDAILAFLEVLVSPSMTLYDSLSTYGLATAFLIGGSVMLGTLVVAVGAVMMFGESGSIDLGIFTGGQGELAQRIAWIVVAMMALGLCFNPQMLLLVLIFYQVFGFFIAKTLFFLGALRVGNWGSHHPIWFGVAFGCALLLTIALRNPGFLFLVALLFVVLTAYEGAEAAAYIGANREAAFGGYILGFGILLVTFGGGIMEPEMDLLFGSAASSGNLIEVLSSGIVAVLIRYSFAIGLVVGIVIGILERLRDSTILDIEVDIGAGAVPFVGLALILGVLSAGLYFGGDLLPSGLTDEVGDRTLAGDLFGDGETDPSQPTNDAPQGTINEADSPQEASTPESTPTVALADEPLEAGPQPDEEFVRYWTAISSGDYEQAWQMLSPRFKAEHHNNDINEYIRGYEDLQICRTDPADVRILSQGIAETLVYGNVTYVRGANCEIISPVEFQFTMIQDQNTGSWLIDRVEIP